jgi:hypothetical protein
MRRLLWSAMTGGLVVAWLVHYGASRNDPSFYDPEFFAYRMAAYALAFAVGAGIGLAFEGLRLLWKRISRRNQTSPST